MAVGVGLFTLLGMFDWMLQNNIVSPEGWYLGAYANTVSFIIFGFLMYRRYVNAIGEVEQVNASLAQRCKRAKPNWRSFISTCARPRCCKRSAMNASA